MNINIQRPIFTLALLSLLLPAPGLLAQAPEGTMAIEQDWTVEVYSVSNPDRGTTNPQFISGFAIPNVPALFQTTWNHRDIPIGEEGGIQLQAYSWDELQDEREILTPEWKEKLSENNETVTWTQRLHITDLDYVYTVKNITGSTWGSLPGPFSVTRRFLSWTPPLELYTFEEIRKHTGITAGSNRFKKLAIVQTRFYDANGELLSTDSVERVLFQQGQQFRY
jgi:hypothetical protein